MDMEQISDFSSKFKAMEEENEKLKQSINESQKREKLLLRRLNIKEQQAQDLLTQIIEIKATIPSKINLVDPAINLIFKKLKNELNVTKAKLEETQNELTAWKFTADSNVGKRLMAKCRLLYQENEELGKIVSNGRLQNDIEIHKNVEDLKRSQADFEGIIQDLDLDVEGFASNIILLQQKVKTLEEKNLSLERELSFLRKENDQNRDIDSDQINSDQPPHKKPLLDSQTSI